MLSFYKRNTRMKPEGLSESSWLEDVDGDVEPEAVQRQNKNALFSLNAPLVRCIPTGSTTHTQLWTPFQCANAQKKNLYETNIKKF